MYDCDKFEIRYMERQQGQLDSDEQAEFDQHLSTCDHCAALDLNTIQLVETMQSLPQMDPPVGFEFRLKRRIEEGTVAGQRDRSRRRGFKPSWAALGAGLATGMAVAIALIIPSKSVDNGSNPLIGAGSSGDISLASQDMITPETQDSLDLLRDSLGVKASHFNIDRYSQVVSSEK